jgi:hypothetical protein
MRHYEKPMILTNEDLAEGVYAASGDTYTGECDSAYMKGNWQAADYSLDGSGGYKAQFGCQGCPATRAAGCGLTCDQAYIDGASSYDTDQGHRKPSWEAKGYQPYEKVTDWHA